MQNDRYSFFPPLAPHWAAAASAVSALLGIWPCIGFYEQLRSSRASFLLFPTFAPIIFFVIALLMTYAMARFLERRESDMARWVTCLVPVGAFLVMRGVPNLFSLALIGFVAAWAYIHVQRTNADAQDREEFFNE